jgi:D-methionine transport system substrate-binding protein
MLYKSKFLSIILCCSLLANCGSQTDPNTIVVGTISGPETELVDVAQKVAKQQYGQEIKIVEFNDYNLPNEALNDKTLDANVYQHLPYLEIASAARHYDFEVIGKTFVYPTGIYSKHHKTLESFPQKAIIAIPNDPSNEARALLLLTQAGLITMQSPLSSNIKDITSNPKNLRFKELDAAQLPRILGDVDAAIINTNYAIPAGLDLKDDALFVENKHSPYANIIVIRKNSDKKDKLAILVKALNSPEVQQKAQELFGNAAIPAW